MIDERAVLEARHGIITAIAGESESLVAGVAADVGESPDAVRPVVDLTLRLLLDQPGITKGRAIMRIAGAQAARDGVPAERFLQRFTSTTWMIWEAARAHPLIDQAVLENVGQTLLRGIDLLVGAVADGYNAVDRETVAHDAEMRRALLEDILSTAPADPVAAARRRRMADRYGLDPDALYRVVAVADRSGDADAAIEEGAHALGRRLRRPSRAAGSDASFPLPQVVTWRGLVVVLAKASWPAADKLPQHLGDLLGPDWVAVAGEPVMGVEGIAATMGRLTLSLRTALRIGRLGWIAAPDELALEELVTVDDALLDAAVDRELGAVLADGRRGLELIETLEVYLESGQNMREAGRRLHLAPRTVAYRLERIARLIGHPLDGAALRRMSIAAFAYRMRREDG
jgi:PucR-like helix-turn-helix protein